MGFWKTEQQTELTAARASRLLRCRCRQPNWFLAWCRRRQILGSEDGASLVEFALVFTVMMGFVLVMMQFCLALYSYGMICETARETTRWAAMRGTTCVTATGASCTISKAAVSSHANALGLPNIGGGTLDVVSAFPDPVPGTGANDCQIAGLCRVKVVIAYTVPIRMPLVPKNAILFSTSSEMYFMQ